jgi:mono/diheme cytochrome c family protein
LRLRLSIGLVILAAGAFLTWRAFSQHVAHQADVTPTPELVARGAYLVRAADCVSCHTTAGGTAFAGGREFNLGRMGRLYSPNITPDRETGIGAWSDDDFRGAMQLGIGRGGKHLYPAFPYASYTLLSDADVVAIKAYLFSLPPTRAAPPANALRFPFDQRYLMAFWSYFFNPNERAVADEKRTAGWNRGRYLVEGLGHCGECHTPRNLLQARARHAAYAGATIDGWRAYNITADAASGIGGWSDEALRNYFTGGFAADHGPASGPMAEVIANSLRYLRPEDVDAIIEYLRSIPARATSTASAGGAGATQAQLAHGKQVYEGICANCHRTNGSGSQTVYEALHGARSLHDPVASNMIQAVLHGTSMDTPLGRVSMPGFSEGYSDADLAAAITYARTQLAGQSTGVDSAAVGRFRHAP